MRRSWKNKNIYKSFIIYYVNIRGIKSKIESLEEIIETVQPTVVCLVETHLNTEEKVQIPGYKVYCNNRTRDGGGILVAVKESLSSVIVEVKREMCEYETLWLKLDNTRQCIRLGVVYAPQEAKSKEIYTSLEKEVKEAENRQENLIIVGDFNCKIGKAIKGNTEEITSAGKKLVEMAKKLDLHILNSNGRCKGIWTRNERGKKSVIDYAITKAVDETAVERVQIDEEKLVTPHTLGKKITYSDHCAMIVRMNWNKALREERKEEKYLDLDTLKEKTQKAGLSKIAMRKIGMQEKYKIWQSKLSSIVEKCKRKVKKKKRETLKVTRRLMKIKRKIKKVKHRNKIDRKRKLLELQEKLIDEYMQQERERERGNQVKRIAEEIKQKGGVTSAAFWDFKKKIDGQKQNALTAIKNSEGKIIEDKEGIKKEYQQFYENLFQEEEPTSTEEKNAWVATELYIQWIQGKNKGKYNQNKIKDEEIEKQVKKMKNKGTMDRQQMNNKIFRNMGKDLQESLGYILKEVKETKAIPDEWKEMEILSIHKNKGSRMEMENKRGIFITNTVSKIFEKIMLSKSGKKIEDHISRYQCGGISNRSTCDHLLTLNAVIEYNKYLGSATHIWFGDAFKCFDKLRLKDCIKDLGEAAGCEEALMIYNLNKQGKAVVKCPAGETNEFEIKESVRQGTIYGPKLCSISTDKVNTISRKSITMIRNVAIESLIYVDDIMFPCSRKEGIETAISNCHSMEKLKGFTFNTKPEKSAILTVHGKKEQEEAIKGEVKNGLIGKVKEYKYLGEWYTDKGTHELSLKKRKEKMEYMMHEIMKYGDTNKVGQMALEIRLKIYETVVVPTIFANVETWSHIKEAEIKELEGIQYRLLRGSLEQKMNTPYWGLLAETGVWPVENRIEYKKIMLYHNIVTSEEKRLIKEIVEDQVNAPYEKCWGLSIIRICKKYKIKIEDIPSYSKQVLKREIKDKIREEIKQKIEEKRREMKKLRFVKENGRQDYILKLDTRVAVDIMKFRLNMAEVKANFRAKEEEPSCSLCKSHEDNTEHLFLCEKLKWINRDRWKVEDLDRPSKELWRFLKLAIEMKEAALA